MLPPDDMSNSVDELIDLKDLDFRVLRVSRLLDLRCGYVFCFRLIVVQCIS